MNKRLALMFCASSLAAVACGSSDKPAQSSYEAQTTSARANEVPVTPSPASTTPMTSSTPMNDPSTSSTVYPSTDTSGTRIRATTGSKPAMNDTTAPANPPPGATPPAAPGVTNNPGPTDGTKGADNTRVNQRDRHDASLTPMDQGKSEGERKITAEIRKRVVSDKALSFGAKNVKIITVGSKVTLRGPVKSEQEKMIIETYAKQMGGVTEVDDQLEIAK